MEADRWVERVRAQRSHLPEMQELATLEVELRGLIQALRAAEAAAGPVRTACDDAVTTGARLVERALDLEKTLAASTAGARELTAIQRELDHLRELLARSEDHQLELLFSLEPLEEEVARVKARAQPGLARRGELLGIIKDLQASLDDELASLHLARDERAAQVNRELLERYERALARAGTSGAAQVNAARCDGCRIALSPLDLDRWKVMPADSFMACPECGRLLLP